MDPSKTDSDHILASSTHEPVSATISINDDPNDDEDSAFGTSPFMKPGHSLKNVKKTNIIIFISP